MATDAAEETKAELWEPMTWDDKNKGDETLPPHNRLQRTVRYAPRR